MITEETFQKLADMRMYGFSRGLHEQIDSDQYDRLAFDERVGLLVDKEWTEREARSLTRRLQIAKLRDRTACIEDIDHRHPRGLDRSLIRRLATCEWIAKQQNVIVCGPTGSGKTFIACALGHKACRDGHSVIYLRLPRLITELEIARGDGSLTRVLARWAKTDLLILDDWGLTPLDGHARHDILEVLEDRHGNRSTIVAAQMPVKEWHKYIGDPALADAALDRIVHNAHRITLKGESMRRKRSDLTQENDSDN